MKINKKNRISPKAIIGTLFAAVLVSAIIYVAVSALSDNFNPQDNAPERATTESGQELDLNEASDEQREAGERAKEEFIEEGETAPRSSGTIAITNVSRQDGTVTVRTVINGGIQGATCNIIIEDETGSIYQKGVGLQSLGSYYVCAGFDVPVTELAGDNWSITVRYIDANSAVSDDMRNYEVEGV